MTKQKILDELIFLDEVKTYITERMSSLGSELYKTMEAKEQLAAALEELGELSIKFYNIGQSPCGLDHISFKRMDEIDAMIDNLHDIKDKMKEAEKRIRRFMG